MTTFLEPRGAEPAALAVPKSAATAELSIIIPTYNERDNVQELIHRLDAALAGINWQAIFVDDDSPDGTANVVKSIAAKDPRVLCLRRIGRRGLAGASIEGMSASSAPFVAVMDSDLQHDESLLPAMYALLADGRADLVIGSRYTEGGSASALAHNRGAISRFATQLTRVLTGIRLTDPMSGFFMIRRESFDRVVHHLSTQGFKILLDIVLSAKNSLRISELPYSFGVRLQGDSKFDTQAALDFLGLLAAKLTGGLLTPRFVFFGLVGAVGVAVHLLILKCGLWAFELDFGAAQTLATFIAMTNNFFLNNAFTYRDRRLRGADMFKGLVGFYVFSSFGAITNVGLASWLYAYLPIWWLAGTAGALVGAIWNFSMSNLFVWRLR